MKKINLLIRIVLIINIFLLVYLVFFVEPIEEYTYFEYKSKVEGKQENNVEENKIFPENYYIFATSYKGEIPKDYFYKGLYNLVNEELKNIYLDTKNMSDSKIKTYFEENKEKIALNIGIQSIEDFKNLINCIKIYNNEELQYESTLLESDTYKNNEDFVEFNIIINYSNNEKITFKVYFSNFNNIDEPLLQFIPMKEE